MRALRGWLRGRTQRGTSMSMTARRVGQLGGAAGILFVIVGVVALFLPGAPPKADEVSKIATYLTDKRGGILAANYLAGIAFVLFLFFVASPRLQLGPADRTRLRPGG